MATESTTYSSTFVDPASAPTVVGNTDDAAFVAAAHDGRNERLSARLQDGPDVLGYGPRAIPAPPISGIGEDQGARRQAAPNSAERHRTIPHPVGSLQSRQGPSTPRGSGTSTSPSGGSHRRNLQNSLQSRASRSRVSASDIHWARDMIRSALSSTSSSAASTRQSPSARNLMTGTAGRLQNRLTAQDSEVRSVNNDTIHRGVHQEDPGNISDTPGTRALWRKLGEIARLQESDPSVAEVIAGHDTSLAGSLALCARAPPSWGPTGHRAPQEDVRRAPHLLATDDGARRSSTRAEAAPEPWPPGDGLSGSPAALPHHQLSRIDSGSPPGAASIIGPAQPPLERADNQTMSRGASIGAHSQSVSPGGNMHGEAQADHRAMAKPRSDAETTPIPPHYACGIGDGNRRGSDPPPSPAMHHSAMAGPELSRADVAQGPGPHDAASPPVLAPGAARRAVRIQACNPSLSEVDEAAPPVPQHAPGHGLNRSIAAAPSVPWLAPGHGPNMSNAAAPEPPQAPGYGLTALTGCLVWSCLSETQ